MKALTVRQPWASLIACGAKRLETRSWATGYWGPNKLVAIHAASRAPRAVELADALGLLQLAGDRRALRELPFGAIVAVARLGAVYSTDADHGTYDGDALYDLLERGHERQFGDFSPGRFAWRLDDVTPLGPPLACLGMLGLWEPRLVADPRRSPEPCELDEESFDRLHAAFARLAITNRELEGES